LLLLNRLISLSEYGCQASPTAGQGRTRTDTSLLAGYRPIPLAIATECLNMNNVNTNALPSRLIIGAALAVVAAGLVTYALHTAAPAPKTAQVAPLPPAPPPPVAQNPTPPPAAAPSPEAPAAAVPAPAASDQAAQPDSATPSEPKLANNRHTAKAHSRSRTSDDSADTAAATPPVVAATPPPAPAAPAVDSTATAAAANSGGDATAAPADAGGVDSKITTEVKSRLAADNVTKDANISVTTTQGVVVLTGTLASQDAVDHVRLLAQNVPDVKSVDTSALKVTGNS
jgi:hypothetical protein